MRVLHSCLLTYCIPLHNFRYGICLIYEKYKDEIWEFVDALKAKPLDRFAKFFIIGYIPSTDEKLKKLVDEANEPPFSFKVWELFRTDHPFEYIVPVEQLDEVMGLLDTDQFILFLKQQLRQS